MAIVLLGSEMTYNSLNYKHVRVLRDLEPVNWGTAQLAENEVHASSFEGDWMDALGVALDLIHTKKEGGHAYEKKQILLFTPFDSPFQTSEKTERIYINAFNQENAELFVIGSSVQFDEDGNLLSDVNLKKGEATACKIIEQVHFCIAFHVQFISFLSFRLRVLL